MARIPAHVLSFEGSFIFRRRLALNLHINEYDCVLLIYRAYECARSDTGWSLCGRFEMRILLATDGSDYAAHAARVVAGLEAQEPIHLTVLSVSYLPDDLQSGTVQPWYADWKKMETRRIREHYRKVEPLLDKVTGSVSMLQVDGSPAKAIQAAAEETEADLVVVGARGHSTLERILIGSVSDTLATHAPCSVLVVRPETHEDEPAKDATKFTNIAIAYDGSPASKIAINEFKSLFHWPDSTSVHITSVVPTINPVGLEYFAFNSFEKDDSEVKSRMEEAKRELADRCKNVDYDLLHEAHVGEAILKSASRAGANLIMLGESGHSPLGELFLGSTSKYVLRHATSSVWVSREKRVSTEPSAETASAVSAADDLSAVPHT